MKSSVIVHFEPIMSTFLKHSAKHESETFSETLTESTGKLFPLTTWIVI